MTPLDPQPPGCVFDFTKALDPFHVDAFEGTPAEGVAGTRGERKQVFMALDRYGTEIMVMPIPEGREDHTVEDRDGIWYWIEPDQKA